MENKRFTTLKKQKEFSKLKQKGKRFFPCDWLIVNYSVEKTSGLQVGWTVPRYVGIAVTRNKLKRWCREILRKVLKQHPELQLKLNVVFKRKSKDFYKNLKYEEFETELLKFFKRIEKFNR